MGASVKSHPKTKAKRGEDLGPSRKGIKLQGFPLELPKKMIHLIKPQDLMKLKQPSLYFVSRTHPFFSVCSFPSKPAKAKLFHF